MAIIKPKCSLWGKKFSPKKLLVIPNIIIKHSNEPEDYNSKNSATTYNYGACYIETPREIKNHLRIEWMLDYILEHREKFEKSGATDIVFEVDWYGLQGNMEFNVIEIKKLALLEIPFSLDYIQQESDDE